MKTLLKTGIIFFALMLSCKNKENSSHISDSLVEDTIQKIDLEIKSKNNDTISFIKEEAKIEQIKNTGNCIFEKQKLISHIEDTYLFDFENFSFELKSNEEDDDFNVIINKIEYNTKLIFDLGAPFLSNYKCNNENIFMVYLEDFYSSAYFAYYYSDSDLFYLGSFVILEDSDVEEHGGKEHSFKILKKEDVIEITSFLGGNFYKKNIFKTYRKISRK